MEKEGENNNKPKINFFPFTTKFIFIIIISSLTGICIILFFLSISKKEIILSQSSFEDQQTGLISNRTRSATTSPTTTTTASPSITPSSSQVFNEDTICYCRKAVHFGVWVDNLWTWHSPFREICDFHHFSPVEAINLLSDECILIIGDSTSRRLSYTLANFLAHPDGLDKAGVGYSTIPCLEFVWAPHLYEVEDFINQLNTTFTTIIINSVNHYLQDRHEKYFQEHINNIKKYLCQLTQSGTKVIFRTAQLPAQGAHKSGLKLLNNIIRSVLFQNKPSYSCTENQKENQLHLFDQYYLMLDRSVGDLRTSNGDDPSLFHVSTEGRYTILQALLNQIYWIQKNPYLHCDSRDEHISINVPASFSPYPPK